MIRHVLFLLVAQLPLTLPGPLPPHPGDTMAVRVSGRGDPVVLVPGLLGAGYGFRELLPLLDGAGFGTVVVDLLGTGGSSRARDADYSLEAQAAHLAFVLDTLGVSDARLVAHAIGGSVALRLTLSRPDLVSAVLLIEAGPAESATTEGLGKALKLAPLIKLFGSGKVRGKMRDQMVSASGDPSWVVPWVVDGYAGPAVEDLGATLDAFRAMASSREPAPLAPRLGAIHEPVRLLLGGFPHDGGPSRCEVETLAQELQDFDMDTLPGIGHFPHEESPGLVLDAVLRLPVRRRARVNAGLDR